MEKKWLKLCFYLILYTMNHILILYHNKCWIIFYLINTENRLNSNVFSSYLIQIYMI